MARKYLAALAALVLLFGCGPEKGTPAPENDPEAFTGDEHPLSFNVNVTGLRLRKTPGPEGELIRVLEEQEVLYDLGEVSDFTTPIQLRGVRFDEPWLKVATETGETGWVYAGALSFSTGGGQELAQTLLERRLKYFFGPDLYRAIGAYRENFRSAPDAAALASAYREGMALRDNLVKVLEDKIAAPETDGIPDLFWLREAIPGFIPQLVAEGTLYHLFADYRAWHTQAEGTPENTDDAFFQLCLDMFPDDGIEYFYPVWFLQTWDYGGHSLLGRSLHLQFLQQLSAQNQADNPFLAELDRIRQMIIDDISAPHITYYEPAAAIVSELETILRENPDILQPADRIALQTRLEQFRNPGKTGIQVNQKEGEEVY